MPIYLTIDRIILDGLPLDAEDGAVVQRAVEAEVTRLLADPETMAPAESRAPGLRRGASRAWVRGGTLAASTDLSPDRLGRAIARATIDGLRS